MGRLGEEAAAWELGLGRDGSSELFFESLGGSLVQIARCREIIRTSPIPISTSSSTTTSTTSSSTIATSSRLASEFSSSSSFALANILSTSFLDIPDNWLCNA